MINWLVYHNGLANKKSWIALSNDPVFYNLEYSTSHLYFLSIHTSLQPQVCKEIISDKWDTLQYITRKSYIPILYHVIIALHNQFSARWEGLGRFWRIDNLIVCISVACKNFGMAHTHGLHALLACTPIIFYSAMNSPRPANTLNCRDNYLFGLTYEWSKPDSNVVHWSITVSYTHLTLPTKLEV